ncbi:hypothetical protein G5V57_17725 [Nordella sp. HKS 07]|uniref:hypothetical protein n=1 Tax=Nordella sp. HKS 07 TaxID=2712222 RepID=UPI0013E113E9|nr:hypothetical protein [Nordella sp. HKS 07]QIG49395.1 hypothetical protein G5V57_17725 [Nordella sp. HKS 07]
MLEDEENSLTCQRWVKIMADFSADGVWDKQGELCHLADLPVSDALKQRISAWIDWYDREADADGPNVIPFDVRQFSEQGVAIARDVKRELTDWTVVYFDERRCNESILEGGPANRSYFEYEVKVGDVGDQ